MSEGSHTVRNIFIFLLVISILFIGLYVIYQKSVTSPEQIVQKATDIKDVDLSSATNYTKEELVNLAKLEILKDNGLIVDETDDKKVWIVVSIIIVILVLGLLYYIFIYNKDDEDNSLKQPVPIDIAKSIFREKISKEYGLGWYVNENNEFQLKNEREFYYRDQKVFYHKATGDKFLLLEFIVNNGMRLGLHIVVMPVDRGEKTILEGDYTIQHQTDYKDFSGKWKRYPITSIVDKKERTAMYIAEQIADGGANKDALEYLEKSQKPDNNNRSYRDDGRSAFMTPFGGQQNDEDDDSGDGDGDDEDGRSRMGGAMSMPRRRPQKRRYSSYNRYRR